MISYVIGTWMPYLVNYLDVQVPGSGWMLCLVNFPARMDCDVGYRIPSSSSMLLAGYSLSVLLKSSLGHSQVGHSMVELSAVAAIIDLQSVQADGVPERTILSAQR